MPVQDLAGRTVLITGVTGFLGTAVTEKLIRSVPGVRILALVRPGRAGAARRIRDEVLASSAFAPLRERLGAGFDAEVARIVPVAGDLGRERLGLDDEAQALLAGVDVVIHSAAEVAFDSALDVALRTNLGGPVRVVDTVVEAGGRPAVVHVSTAYVSGVRRGLVLEGRPGGLATAGGAGLDWRAELRAADAVRARLEAESRSPGVMRGFAARALRGLGASGVPAGGAEVERLRQRWVDARLVEHGRQHARALGWSDVYTLSKSLAEAAMAETCAAAGLPLSVVRPSIIESAVAEPRPGWITGLRMAEPIILAFGRGQLQEFPGLPDGIIDLVPVDAVSNVVITAAATPPPVATPAVYHVSSGARNPLRFRGLVEHVSAYFSEHPLHDSSGAPIPVPRWTFPSGRSEERRLALLERALETAVTVMERGPATARTRSAHERLEEGRDRVRRARSLAQMYAVYTEMDAVFDDTATHRLDLERDAAERATFPFDVGTLDWTAYLQGSHFPAVIELARVRRREPRPPAPRPTQPAAQPAPAPRIPRVSATPALAVFDVEGTVADLTVVQHYLFFLLEEQERRRWPLTLARTALRVPGWLRQDRVNRLDFQRRFYRRYAGWDPERIAALSRRALHEITLPRAYPAALRRIRDHVDAGHRVVLITGALDEVVRPLAELLEVEIRAARLRVVDGVYDGDLAETPPTAEARGMLVGRLATEAGLPPADGYAYADSISDLSMLEAVGHPVPVNPDLKLMAVARRRGWPVQHWAVRDGAGRMPVVLPAAVGG